jgi:hypothetical protein
VRSLVQQIQQIQQILVDFRTRCPRVLGTFVLNSLGQFLVQELPSFVAMENAQLDNQISDIYLALETQRRLNRSSISHEHDVLLRFQGLLVYARTLRAGFLVLLAEHDADVVKLRALSNLLIKRLELALVPVGAGS